MALEDNVKRLVSEVTRLNREAGVEVDPNVIAYMACLKEVEKAWEEVTGGASITSGPFEPPLIAKLGALLSSELRATSSPYLAAAKLQVMMEVEFKRQRAAVDVETEEHAESADMLARSIISTPSTRSTTVAQSERLHRQVVEYVCVKSRLGPAIADETAREEVRAAVESVFPLSALARFLTLGEAERTHQIEELARICLGICLYNRHTGQGGYALPPASSSYVPQAQRLARDLTRHSVDALADVRLLSAYQVGHDAPGASPEDAAAARARAGAEALACAQALSTLQQLSADLAAGLDAAQQLEEETQHVLEVVSAEVGSSAAVQKDAVFPLFERAGKLHVALGEELRLLVVRQRLFDAASSLLGGYDAMVPRAGSISVNGKKTTLKPSPAARALTVASVAERAADDAAAAAPPPDWPPPVPDGLEFVAVPASEGDADLLHMLQGLSLGGFCPVALAKSGLLRPAAPSVGLLREHASGQLLGFFSAAALAEYAAGYSSEGAASSARAGATDSTAADGAGAATESVAVDEEGGAEGGTEAGAASAQAVGGSSGGGGGGVLSRRLDEVVLERPLLWRLLGRSDELHPALSLQAVVDAMSGPLKVDFASQTPTHFVEKHIDYTYEWNEWALRRRALALANLRQKRTHSTQTAQSHYKRDGDTQVWLPKAATVQTCVDKGQAMPKKLQYVQGLRGAPATKMHVVRLELDLGQPHQH
ncbi:hypothetical protein FOA52_011447 [Chlamydomonas sp. UWO 241]|nr:hypothetical protein FOA52_011447 [Chlamydomonas sp. UWO 241]